MIERFIENTENKIVWLYALCHGKNTPGKRGPEFIDSNDNKFQIKEWEYGRDIIKRLIDINISTGTNFIVLNPADTETSTITIAKKANEVTKELYKKGYKVFGIDLHGNAHTTPKANGIEIFTSVGLTKADVIATIFYEFYSNLGLKMRPDFTDIDKADVDKEKDFNTLKLTIAPFILPEIGFYTNYHDALLMNTNTFKKYVAQLTWSAQRKVENKVKMNLL